MYVNDYMSWHSVPPQGNGTLLLQATARTSSGVIHTFEECPQGACVTGNGLRIQYSLYSCVYNMD